MVAPEILKRTKCRIYHLFSRMDGNFPNRGLNCTEEKNLVRLKKEILKKKADLGVAFDGDGDRIVFLDEKGIFVPPSVTTAIIASILLKKYRGRKILYTVNQSNIVPETIEKSGGIAVLGRAGHSNIKRQMRKDSIIFAGELSAHYFFKKNHFCEEPFAVLLLILNELSQKKMKLSELAQPFQKYFHSGEINLRVKNKNKALAVLENKFKRGSIIKIDGLRINFGDWWFNLRMSQTEPILRLTVEAKTKKLMLDRVKEIKSIISKF
jgi:phosphomannomutase